MTLTLTLANVDVLDNGQSAQIVLDRHGALIGRSPNADWCLPDPKKHISFTHCEIIYRGGEYLLVDKSTNGTFLNGSREKLQDAHVLASGDEFAVGHYRVLVRVVAPGGSAEPPLKPKASGDWTWDTAAPPLEPPASGGWSDLPVERPQQSAWPDPAPAPATSGRGPLSQNWMPPRVETPPAQDDVWARFDRANQVDWGAGTPRAPQPWPSEPPLQAPPTTQPAPALPAPSYQAPRWPTQAPTSPAPRAAVPSEPDPPVARQAPMPAPNPALTADGAWSTLLQAAGLTPADIKAPPQQAAATAGALLHRLIAGLMVMLEARARAKNELGATATMIEIHGNSPLKFSRHPDAALARLLNPPERGYMDAERTVEDAFRDLQAHQMASLAAMQGALRATLARFSPSAIRGRAEQRGILARILPAARDAALWQAYEREFEGVVKGSDEAFMDFFAKAFREAYQKASVEMRR